MKYYAVTEDPRELFHYGVKGMKWGQHLFGEDLKPKSPSYKRAANKLRALSKKSNEGLKTTSNVVSSLVRKGIVKKNAIGNALKRTAAQISYNYNKHKQNQFNKAVQKAQIRNNLTAALHSLDKEEKYRKEIDRERKAAEYNDKIRNIRADNDLKQLRNSVKIERKMPKYMQRAREGLTGYGKFTEEQLGRIQERLSMENMTRRLGGNEYPKFRTRLKKATQEGIIEGTKQGVANAMVEVAKAKVQNKYGNRKTLDQQNVIRAQRKHDADRIEKERTDSEIKRDLKKEAYESELRSGKGYMSRHGFGSHMTIADAGKITSENRERQNRLNDANEQHKFDLQEKRNAQKNKREQREKLEEEEATNAEIGKQIQEYGAAFIPVYTKDGKRNGTKVITANSPEAPSYITYYKNWQKDNDSNDNSVNNRAKNRAKNRTKNVSTNSNSGYRSSTPENVFGRREQRKPKR